MEGTVKTKKSLRIPALVVALALLIACTVLMWGFGSDWGYVKVERIRIISDDGLTYSALLYVPENATNDTPAPAFMGQHGRSASGRDMETWAIEMARRGYVCLLPDAAGGGESQRYAADAINGPVDVFFNYLTGLPIVQGDQICIAGISQGTDSTSYLALTYPERIRATCLMAAVSGNVSGSEMDTNVQYIYGLKDESISLDPNSRRGAPLLGVVKSYNYALGTNFTEFEEIELDKYYGSIEDNTARITNVYNMVHSGGTFNFSAIGAMVGFFMECTEAPRPIDPGSANWHMREFFGLLVFLLFVVCIILTCTSLLKLPFFARIKQPVPQCVGLKKRGWIISGALAIIAPILLWLYIPRSQTLTNNGTALLPANHLNAIVLWMLYMSVFGVLMFILFHFTDGKKQGGNLATYGLTYTGKRGLSFGLIGRSFLLAALTVWIAFMGLYCMEELTGFTPHFWFLGYTKLVSHRLHVVPMYALLYFFAFMMAGLGMNIERGLPSTGSEKKDTARAVIINVFLAGIGITLVLLFQWFFQYNQMTYLGAAQEMLSLGQVNSGSTLTNNSQFGISAMVAIAAGINTYCYRKTGSLWTGVFLCALWTAFSAVMCASLAM